MFQPKPHFMENEKWFYFDEEEFCYKLTAEATKEAKESYEKFYAFEDYLIEE